MKKFVLVLATLLLIVGCQKKLQYDEFGNVITPEPTSESEKIYYMISQAINDYNEGLIQEREIEWNTTIKPMPLEISEISNIKSLNDLKEIKIENRITNAIYDGSYKIDRYTMIFEVFNIGTSLWLNGKTSFHIDTDTIVVNNPEFSQMKSTLDSLLLEDLDILTWLYGVNVTLGEESKEYPGFYKVVSIGDNKYNSIQELKNKAESIFTKDFLQTYYAVAFESDDPIYREINNVLYCSVSESDIFSGLPYDTSRIVAVEETDSEVLIDLVISFGEDVDSELQRIILVKTDQGLRFNNAY